MTKRIRELWAAIFRNEERLAQMAADLGPDQCPCCVGAAYGGTVGPYDTLRRKIDRQEAWLAVLVAKESKSADAFRVASAHYGEVVNRHRRIK